VPTTPSRTVIACTVDDDPLSGAYVIVTLPMWEKNQYHLLFGPSNEHGLIHVTGDELQSMAEREANAFPMDYAGFPDGWTGGMGVEVVDASGLERLRSGVRTWGSGSFRPEYPQLLDAYADRLDELGSRRLSAEVARSA
jgi:hypothetical protein